MERVAGCLWPRCQSLFQGRSGKASVFEAGLRRRHRLIATTDDEGTPLDGACQYRIVGGELPSRIWTLTLTTDKGELIDNPSRRYSLQSQNISRVGGNRFEVVTGPDVMGGDWLKSAADVPFRLILRLYETPHTSGGGYSEINLPSIAWMSCQ